MLPISSFVPGVEQSPMSISGVKEPPKIERPEDEGQSRPIKPVKDEYIPEEKQEPIGRYWPGKDEEGNPKIFFDDPEQGKDADAPDKSEGGTPKINSDDPEQDKDADAPDKKASGDKAASCTINTDKVDREIEKLKKRQGELEQQINSETDDKKLEKLTRELKQVESELLQKDNDTYRRQNAVVS